MCAQESILISYTFLKHFQTYDTKYIKFISLLRKNLNSHLISNSYITLTIMSRNNNLHYYLCLIIIKQINQQNHSLMLWPINGNDVNYIVFKIKSHKENPCVVWPYLPCYIDLIPFPVLIYKYIGLMIFGVWTSICTCPTIGKKPLFLFLLLCKAMVLLDIQSFCRYELYKDWLTISSCLIGPGQPILFLISNWIRTRMSSLEHHNMGILHNIGDSYRH